MSPPSAGAAALGTLGILLRRVGGLGGPAGGRADCQSARPLLFPALQVNAQPSLRKLQLKLGSTPLNLASAANQGGFPALQVRPGAVQWRCDANVGR